MLKLAAMTLLLLQAPTIFASEFLWTVTVTDLNSRKETVYKPMDQRMNIPVPGMRPVCNLSETATKTTADSTDENRWIECDVGTVKVRTMGACYRNRPSGNVSNFNGSMQIYGGGHDRDYVLSVECK